MSQQRDLRRAAAEAFFESLEHFEQTIEADDEKVAPQQPQNKAPQPKPANPPVQFDLASLEDAIADIEQFIQQQETSEE